MTSSSETRQYLEQEQKEQKKNTKNMKSSLGGVYFSPPRNKGEGGLNWYGKMRKVVEMGIGKVESVNKNLGGEKKKR